MSTVDIYHYKETWEVEQFQEWNGRSFNNVKKLFSASSFATDDAEYAKSFNDYQNNPEVWRSEKIVATFASDKVLVLDSDRTEVVSAIMSVLDGWFFSDSEAIEQTLTNVARRLNRIKERWPIVMTPSVVESDQFLFKDIVDRNLLVEKLTSFKGDLSPEELEELAINCREQVSHRDAPLLFKEDRATSIPMRWSLFG